MYYSNIAIAILDISLLILCKFMQKVFLYFWWYLKKWERAISKHRESNTEKKSWTNTKMEAKRLRATNIAIAKLKEH